MIATYGWRLEKEKTRNNVDEILARLNSKETIEHSATYLKDVHKINDTFPGEEVLRTAQGLANGAYIEIKKENWQNALDHYRAALQLVERFRSPQVVAFVKELLYFSARCSMNHASPIAAILSLKKAFLIGDVPEKYFSLYEKAKSEDKERISTFINEFQKNDLPAGEIGPLINYLLYYPLPSRINTAKEMLDGCVKKNPADQAALLYLARCSMEEGNPDEALELIEKMDHKNDERNDWLNQWKQLLGKKEVDQKFLFENSTKELSNLDHLVYRGFSLLANGLHREALHNFFLAMRLSTEDPFTKFGYALTLWSLGSFGLAKRAIKDAIQAKDHCSQPRFLSFFRVDDTIPSKSYRYNTLYPIYNMEYCEELISKGEPYVSYVIIP